MTASESSADDAITIEDDAGSGCCDHNAAIQSLIEVDQPTMMKTLILLLLFLLGYSVTNAFSTSIKIKDALSLNVIGKDKEVIFFPSAGYRDGNEYCIPIHGWVFDPERRSLRRRAFLSILANVVDDVLNDKDDDEATDSIQVSIEKTNDENDSKKILSRRVNPFIVDNHRRRKITIRLRASDDDTVITRELPKRSRKNGHFQGLVRLSQEEMDQLKSNNDCIRYEAVTGIKDDERSFAGVTHILEPTGGLSVISDVDDTVKISHVLDKKRLIRHTFLEEFQAVPGMARLYQKWKEEKNASFHYVSSSPWQLYQEIASFLEIQGFPTPASFSLKSIRLKDRSLFNLFADPMVSKLSKISSIIETFPQRKYILVGDTGERDPEVYGEICRRFPHQVQKVYLRDVLSELDPILLQELNAKQLKKKHGLVLDAPDRYTKAFRGVPYDKWSLFTNPDTIDY